MPQGDPLAQRVGRVAQNQTIEEVMDRFLVSKGYVVYHRNNFAFPQLHPSTWGGARHFKFDPMTEHAVESLLAHSANANGFLTASKHQTILLGFGWEVSESYIQRRFQRWKQSMKRVNRENVSHSTWTFVFVNHVMMICLCAATKI